MIAHLFEVEDAKKHGLAAAVVLNHIRHWIQHNKANGKNERDGRTWTYNSVKAWSAILPYLTPKQVRRAIDDLVAGGVLVKANFNATPYDRTLWYALGDGVPTAPLCPEGQKENPDTANPNAPDGKCVDQSNTREETKEPAAPAVAKNELQLEAERFVQWFLALLATTGAPTPRMTPTIREGWLDAYEKLRRLDGKEMKEIARVCEWARSDPFWSGNFFSPTKLRERKQGISRYDLFLQRINHNGNPPPQRSGRGFAAASANAYAGVTDK